MDVITNTRTDAELEEYDYQDYLEIYVNGKLAFSVQDGEPEDSNLSRDFSDCFNIPKLMLMAYEAGVKGEVLTIDDLVVEKPTN